MINVANDLWLSKEDPPLTYTDRFLKTMKSFYSTSFHEADYLHDYEGARKEINKKVAKDTKDKIKDLLPPRSLDTTTKLVITNAIYFEGEWLVKFNKNKTRPREFYQGVNDMISTPMMEVENEFPYKRGDGYRVVELPYHKWRASMLVILPDEVDGLPALEQRIAKEGVEPFITGLSNFFSATRPDDKNGKKSRYKMECDASGPEHKDFKRSINLIFPKFKMEFQTQLKEPLQSLGMNLAFSGADFSGLLEGDPYPLTIDNVYHKAFIELDEEKTVAAAATAVVIRELSAFVPMCRVEVNHPFIFLIRENKTGAILFMGRFLKPEAAQ